MDRAMRAVARLVARTRAWLAGGEPVKEVLPLQDLTEADRDLVRWVSPYTMTSPERIVHLSQAIKYVCDNEIQGDVVECGVWRGGSMMAAARTLIEIGDLSRTLYLFDTFEGMTKAGSHDLSVLGQDAGEWLTTRPRREDDMIWAYACEEDVRRNMRATRYPEEKMKFVRGAVQETLPKAAPERIALLRLDTDWYESTAHELETLYPKLSRNGVLIIDDYGWWAGARKATDEFLAKLPHRPLLFRVDNTARSCLKP